MAKRRRETVDPATIQNMQEEIASWERGEGDEPFFAPNQPNFDKPKKGSVKKTACQTLGCPGMARHFEIPWLFQSNSFYCWLCVSKRGIIAALLSGALVLSAGLILMLLPMIGLVRIILVLFVPIVGFVLWQLAKYISGSTAAN